MEARVKFAFNELVRVVVEAPSLAEAVSELEGLELLTLGTDGPLEIRRAFDDGREWVRACRVCGCTDDDACEDGCEWQPLAEGVMEGLCSTEDEAHAAALAELRALVGAAP